MQAKHKISRRTVLRGLGAAVAIPWLESRSGRAIGAEPEPPLRMAFFFVPNGMNMDQWTISSEGPLKKLSPTLEPLAQHKSKLLVLSGLTLNGGRSLGDGPGDHARCVASYLTGAHPHKTDGKDIENGASVDQVAAEAIGHKTRFPSLELGTQASAQGGRCDSGYSCMYTSNMSWRTATSPMAKEINPRAVFDRLFSSGDVEKDARAGFQREQRRQSILDFVAEDANRLSRKLGAADRRKLDEYLYAVRQIERRLDAEEELDMPTVDGMEATRPTRIPKDLGQHVKLMMDMMVLAIRTDSTRVLSFMYTNAGSNRAYPDIGVDSGHHWLSHHGNDPEKLEQIGKINKYHTRLFAHFLESLAAVKEADGTLLDHVMVTYGSGLADGNRHHHHNLPILLAGGGCGTLRGGRHIRYAEETPLTNLYLAMLDRMGVDRDQLADSTGKLEELG